MRSTPIELHLDPGCEICLKVPTLVRPIRRHVGMVYTHRSIKIRPRLCRTHGKATTMNFLVKTLWQGWWSLLSVVINTFDVVSNLVVLWQFRKLAKPEAN